MTQGTGPPELGVEEEFSLVDGESLQPAPRITDILEDALALPLDYAQAELHRAQIVTASEPSRSLSEIGEQLTERRARPAEAAGRHDALVLASGTYPSWGDLAA